MYSNYYYCQKHSLKIGNRATGGRRYACYCTSADVKSSSYIPMRKGNQIEAGHAGSKKPHQHFWVIPGSVRLTRRTNARKKWWSLFLLGTFAQTPHMLGARRFHRSNDRHNLNRYRHNAHLYTSVGFHWPTRYGDLYRDYKKKPGLLSHCVINGSPA